MDVCDEVIVSKAQVDEVITENQEYKIHLKNQEDMITTLKENEQQYEINIKQLSESLKACKDHIVELEAKNQALNELLEKKDGTITALQNQIVEYNKNDPGKVLQTTLSSLYAVTPNQNYSELDMELLQQELERIRFSHSATTPGDVQKSEFDSFMETKMQELESARALNKKEETLIAELKIEVEAQSSEIKELSNLNSERLENQNKETYESFNNRIKDLQFQLEEMQETNKELNLENEQLEGQQSQNMDGLQAKIDELQSDNIAITELFRQENAENSELKQLVSDMKSELEEEEKAVQNKVERPEVNEYEQTDYSMGNEVIMFQVEHDQALEKIAEVNLEQAEEIMKEFITILQSLQSEVVINKDNVLDELANFVREFNNMLVDLQRLAHQNEVLTEEANNFEEEALKYQQQATQLEDEVEIAHNQATQLKLEVETVERQKQEEADEINEEFAANNNMSIRISELEMEVNNEVTSIQQLQEENQELEQENETYCSEATKLSQTLSGMNDMQQVINKYEVKVNEILVKEKELESKFEQSEKELVAQNTQNKELNNRLAEAQSQNIEAEKQFTIELTNEKEVLAQNEIEIKHLKEEIEDMVNQKQEMDRQAMTQTAEQGRSQNLLEETQLEVTRLSGEIGKYKLELEQMTKEIEDKELQIISLGNDRDELTINFAESKEKIENLNNKTTVLEEENKLLKEKLENSTSTENSKVEQMGEMLDGKNNEIQKLEEENFQLKVEYESLSKEEEHTSQQLQEYEKKVVKLEEIKETSQQKTTDLNIYVRELEQEKSNAQIVIDQLKQQTEHELENYKMSNQELISEKQDYQELLNKYNSINLQNQELEDDILKMKNEEELDIQHVREKVESNYRVITDRQVGQKEEIICQLNIDIVSYKQQINNLQDQLADSNEQTNALKEQESQNEQKYQELDQMLAKVKSNALEMKSTYEDRIKKLKQETIDLKAQEAQISTEAKTQILEVEEKLRSEYGAEIEEIVRKNKELQVINDENEVKLGDYRMEVEKMNYQIQNANQQVAEANKEADAQKNNVSKYKELYKKAYNIVEKKKDEINQYKAVITDLERKLNSVTQERYQQAYGHTTGREEGDIETRAAESGYHMPPPPNQVRDLGYGDLYM